MSVGASVTGAHLSAADRIDAFDAAGRHVFTALAPTSETFFMPVVDGGAARYTITGPGVANSAEIKVDAVQVSFTTPKAATTSGCDLEASCEANPVTVAQSRAVAYIVVANTKACTATLIADKAKSGRGFLLTAEHCQIDAEAKTPTAPESPAGTQSAASTSVFWQAVSACDGTIESAPAVAKAVTIGAVHRMEGADYAGNVWLLEASVVPDSLSLRFAGLTNKTSELNAVPLLAVHDGNFQSQQYVEADSYTVGRWSEPLMLDHWGI